MKIKTIFLALLTTCSLTSCSIFNFWSNDNEEKVVDDKTLCSSKKDIITNHTYIPSLNACQRLSDQGDLNATYVLGLLYTDTSILTSFLDPDTRVEQGVALVKKAADGGIVKAQRSLGEYYADQKGDNENAVIYLQKAVDNGDTDSLIDLGTVYENLGQCQKAADAYRKEIKQNGKNADGYFYLSLLHVTGCKDLNKDIGKACGYFALAQDSQIKNTILKVLEYEAQTGEAAKKNSVTSELRIIHDYETKNAAKCESSKKKLQLTLFD